MIRITKEVINNITAHARQDISIEACGYLAGKDGVITKHYELTNIDKSLEHYSFDPKEQFVTVKDARGLGLELLANYHSHPETPARPSNEDIKLAHDPSLSYVIVSLAEAKPSIKSFIIQKGVVEPEPLEILID